MFIFSFATFAQVTKQERKHMKKETMEKKQNMKMMGDEDPAEFSDRMGMKLGLNAEQKVAVKKAQLKRKESLMELNADHQKEMANEDVEDRPKERAKMHEGMLKINADFRESMQEILDDSQYTKWETMHEEKMKMYGNKKMMHGEKGKMKEKKMKMKSTKRKEKEDQDDDNSIK